MYMVGLPLILQYWSISFWSYLLHYPLISSEACFERIIKSFITLQTMVDAVMATGRQTNCKDDLDPFLLSLSAPPRSTSAAHVLTSAAVTNLYGEAVAALPGDVRGLLCVCMPYDNDDDTSSLNVEEKNVLSYIAGFIIRKLRSKMCSACKDKCVADALETQADHQHFITVKRYSETKDGLIYSSHVVHDALMDLETKYRDVIDEAMYAPAIKMSLVTTFSKMPVMSNLHCSACHLDTLLMHVFVNVRLHHTLK